MEPVRVGIDIGGTFTDLVAAAGGRVEVVKVPSTPDPADGFREALARIGGPGRAAEVRHGTTVGTNAVLERRGARVALLATEGFRDVLHLARQDRPSLYDLRAVRPPPLVPRERCLGVPERLGPDGTVLRPLDAGALRGALAALRDAVDAVAVVLLHAYANPAHERAVGAVVREVLGGVEVSLSSEVLGEFREYERASTTVLNAYVQPVVARYLARIRQATPGVRLGVMRSGGGIGSPERSVREPVHTLLSGPAAGVLGAAWVARRMGVADAVTLDMGGTSTDVSIVEGGMPRLAEEASLDGLPFRTPCIDVVSVGAGGGSVAWVDEGGALRVGPRSAGAVPGPACYGRGGREPTVTDAHVVLGHLGAEGLAGGEVPLHPRLAADALGALGLGTSPEAAGAGVLRVVRATMARAIRRVSVERGKDVRRYALVAFGGAGPLHACALARELGMGLVIVPPVPGCLAALGLLVARPRADASRSRPMPAQAEHDPAARALWAELAEEARGALREQGVASSQVGLAVDCRYAGQSHELRLEVPPGTGLAEVARRFHQAHRERYGFGREDRAVEAVTFRAWALGPPPELELAPPPAGGEPEPLGAREVEGRPVPVYAREDLPAGWRAKGPVVVRELDATVWVEEGAELEVHPTGALVVRP